MDLIKNIVHYFQNNDDKGEKPSPDGTCPVCWGYQQYDGKIRTLLQDRQIDVNNHKESYMIIQDFMKHHINGLKLKDGIISECPNCSDRKNK